MLKNLKSERKSSNVKEFIRSITKVTLAFVLVLFLTGCGSSESESFTIDPEATLPGIGPEIGSTEETNSNYPINTTEVEIISTEETDLTTIDESTKETFEEDETTSVESTTVEQTMVEPTTETEKPTETEEPTSIAEEPADVISESTKYTFTEMGEHMYVQGSVNIRTLPSMDGDIKFVLDVNDIVYVTGKCNETGWYRIDVEGQTFYVSNLYVGKDKVVPRSTIATTTVPQKSGFVYYSVAGQYPNRDYEAYLYNQLDSIGIAWWYPYAVAQIFQESRWNPSSTNGKDHGICQFKGIYFQSRAQHFAGMTNADIWNPYDSLKVYAYYIKAILAGHNNNVASTLSFYICGDDIHWDQTYINHVMGWYNQLKKS